MKTKLFLVCAAVLAALAITACGGSGGGGTAPSITPAAVDSVAGDKMMFSLAGDITVAGSNLDQDISVTASGACSSLTEKTGGTASKRVFSCTPATVGAINVKVSGANGAVLKTAALTVPNPQVTMATSKGTIVVELDPAKAPLTVNNFLGYVHEGFYGSTVFHRVVPGFVVQGGGFSTAGVQKATHSPITLEPPSATGLTNALGTIAMARTTELNSATSQFFINTVDNNTDTGNNLDTSSGGYAVFGSVIQGMDVVRQIEATPVTNQTLFSDLVSVTSMTQTR
ncbi:MAG TPA: peptidylprolyl isomerase [Dongiaceae bacterium]|nr:peptidylprolyl isomerase [Dongiaceae bacterium]